MTRISPRQHHYKGLLMTPAKIKESQTEQSLRAYVPPLQLSPHFSRSQITSSTRMSDTDGLSVNELYREGESTFRFLEETSISPPSEEYQNRVEAAIAALVNVGQYSRSAQLFSTNETLEDVQTTHLRFILSEYYLGLLLLKRTTGDRQTNLKTAKKCLQIFLNQCEQYNLIHEEDKEIFHREKPQKDKLREEKIARYKREKEASRRLDELNRSNEKKERQQRNGYILTVEDDTVDDEERQRDIYKLILGLGCTKAVEEISAIDNEADMLQQIEEMKLKNGGKLIREPPTQQQSQFQNFTLLPSKTKRQEFQEGVFKPSWNLPTMTIEEWADQQIELGLLPGPGTVNQPPQKKKEKNKDEETEEETRKKREWDDWKDEHPKGQGNMNDNYFKR
ncbi:hypothetical protein PROFUN_06619 [Planoprotostelium fungivorum]|uniref:TAP42-like protein n=1 Tax=Planoprotostelium fungivorum TaxID=1890364 RepID=A0A2P6MSS8_9EUKA|nr:hypothetical protein PROFUN_06619 [Planoprotostelium fungivorum]